MPAKRWLLWSMAIALLVLAPFAIADYRLYWSHRQELLDELQTMPAEDRHPPPRVASMFEKFYGQVSIDNSLSRSVAHQYQPRMTKGLRWQLRWLVWNTSLRLHLSKEERLALFCHRLNYDGGLGLSDGAMKYYGKPPEQLDDLEIAGLIASDMRGRFASPFLHREHFESERQKVLERINLKP